MYVPPFFEGFNDLCSEQDMATGSGSRTDRGISNIPDCSLGSTSRKLRDYGMHWLQVNEGRWEAETRQAIVTASYYPLSIIMVPPLSYLYAQYVPYDC